ncbi:MAG: BrnA antitoxin family protein [Kiritimatiellia bacterium]|nr:BrnA antitoxin family protein [Kiritimatiellia bacterium]
MKSKTDWKKLHAMRDNEIDFSDISKVDRAILKKMVVRMPQPKELVSIRIDPDVLGWFRQEGKRYQTRINAVLRSYVDAHSH